MTMKQILVIDDEVDIRELTKISLTGQCEVLKEDSSWSKPMDLKKAPYSAHNVRNRSKLVN
jgi:CheY-like chemotaxis protein